MKIIIILILLNFSAYGQINLGFGNGFGNGGRFGNNFGGGNGISNSFGNGGGFGIGQSTTSQGMSQVGGNGFGNNFGNRPGNNNGNGFGGGFGGGLGNSGGSNAGGGSGVGNNSGNNGTNSVSNTNNVYRPSAVGMNQRRKDNNGYDYGVINSGPSPMFSGRVFQNPLRRVVVGTNSIASARQYLRLNSREGSWEVDSQSFSQNSSNRLSVSSSPKKAN